MAQETHGKMKLDEIAAMLVFIVIVVTAVSAGLVMVAIAKLMEGIKCQLKSLK